MNVTLENEKLSTDLLIIGGGVAGMQAAISAKETDPSVNVLVVEKADTRRSGMGSTGNDHFFCYLPKYHGDDFEAAVADALETQEGKMQDLKLFKKMLWRSREIIEKWESYGIPMRPYGDDFIFEGHALPGKKMFSAKYDGQNQKKILTKVATNNNVYIKNHVTVSDIITDDTGRAIGAVGIDTKEKIPKLITIETKAIILAIGSMTRMYPSSNPAYLFNINECPANAAGSAIAFRAGARLVNYDMIGCHAGPRYFERSGKATWIGLVSNTDGKPVGPFVTKASRKLGDPMLEIWPGVFRTMLQNGKGPVFMDCRSLSQDDMQYMQHCFITEGLTSVNDYMEQRGMDLHRSMIEFGSYALGPHLGGIDIDEFGRTTVPGLYAAGSICGNVHGSITGASVFGMISAEHAISYCKTVDLTSISKEHLTVQKSVENYEAMLSRDDGAHWKEVNSTLQNIMKDYAGEIRSESMFNAALHYLRELHTLANNELKAKNSHELMRNLEVFDLLDLAEVTILAGNYRHDNRGINHNRIDYPFANPLLDGKLETIQKTNDGIKIDYRPEIH
ncbi:MAG: FAD-binding protein [Peptococcaceae bacterium]|nr:FAD-binding protein [Peptococcaceae bacterium]